MNIKAHYQQEQQLLEGVTMTTSISCPPHEALSPQNPHQDHYTIQNESFDFSVSNPAQSRYVSQENTTRDISRSRNLPQTRPLSFKAKSQVHIGKAKDDRKWQNLMQLDNSLIQAHYKGIFARVQSNLGQMNQIVLTEQYCRLKLYQKQLLQVVRQIQFSLSQFQKQKKSFITQIKSLKKDNENLLKTNKQLLQILNQLETSCRLHYDSTLAQDYLLTKSSGRSERNTNKEVEVVPFARMFSHSVQEMELIKRLQEEQQCHPNINAACFAQFLISLNEFTSKLGTQNCPESLKIDFLGDQQLNHENCLIKECLSQVNNNLRRFNTFQKVLPTYSPVKQNFLPVDSQPKIIQIFLTTFTNNQSLFLKNLQSSKDPQLYFWQVIHTAVVTFLGVMTHQTKKCYLQLSFGDNTKVWLNSFLQITRELKQKCNLQMAPQKQRYFSRVQAFLSDINELIVFKMLRS